MITSFENLDTLGLSELTTSEAVSTDGGALPLILVVAGGVSAKTVFATCVTVAGAAAAFTYNALKD